MSVIRSPKLTGSSMSTTTTAATITTAANHGKRSRTDVDGETEPLTLESLLTVMNSQFEATLARIDQATNNISMKIDAVKAELEGKLDAVTREINVFKEECAGKFNENDNAISALNAKVGGIYQEMDGLEKRNELIVKNIPFQQGEDLAGYFKAMWKQVGLSEASYPTIDARRLYSATNSDAPILLEFALRNSRDDFYNSYLRQCNLKLSHIGINSSHRFYVNENLTVAARKIKVAALQLKKAGKLSTVYTKLGTIYVKRSVGQQAIAIPTEEHLGQFT